MQELGGHLGARGRDKIEKEFGLGALCQRRRGLAQTGGLEAFGNSSSVESLQNDAVADHLKLLYRDLCAGDHSQFVHQVNAPNLSR